MYDYYHVIKDYRGKKMALDINGNPHELPYAPVYTQATAIKIVVKYGGNLQELDFIGD
jgi:hypothetical protein